MISRIDGFSSLSSRTQPKNIYNNKPQHNYSNLPQTQSVVCCVVPLPACSGEQSDYFRRFQNVVKLQFELKQLYNKNSLNNESIQKTVNKVSPVPIEVKSFDELPETADKNGRRILMQLEYKDSMKLTGAVLYVNDSFSNVIEASELISDCIYEYSNLLQRNDNEDYLSIGKFTSNQREAKFLGAISKHTADEIEKEIFSSLEQNPNYNSLSAKSDIEPAKIAKLLPPKEKVSEMVDRALDNNFKLVFEKYKIPKQYSGEYNFFYLKSKPFLNESVRKHFEIKSEALLTEMETKDYGLYASSDELSSDAKTRNVFRSLVSLLK